MTNAVNLADAAPGLNGSGTNVTVAGNLTVSGGLVPSSSFLRNRIQNGDMRIDQRATTTTTSGAYTVDRFAQSQSAASAVVSWAQSSVAPPGFTNSLGGTLTTAVGSVPAGAFYRVYQPIEGYNVADFGLGTASASTITLSFWVRSSVPGVYCIGLQNAAVNRSYSVEYTISSANVWEYKSITVPLDTTGTWNTTNGVGMYVYWDLGSGSTYSQANGVWAATNTWKTSAQTPWITNSGATFYLAGVQLEVGTVATPFERRQYGQELALAQRYYCITTGTARFSAVGAQNMETGVYWPSEMRATPTVSSSGGATSNVTVAQSASPTIYGSRFIITSAGTGDAYGLNVEIRASAEL